MWIQQIVEKTMDTRSLQVDTETVGQQTNVTFKTTVSERWLELYVPAADLGFFFLFLFFSIYFYFYFQ